MSRLAKYWRLPGAARRLTLEAAVVLMLAALTLKILPFRQVARWSGARSIQGQQAQCTLLPVRHPGLPGHVGHAVQRAARHLPMNLLCLPQALAAQWMLNRRSIAATLHLGMAKGDKPRCSIQAHAWLTVAGLGVIGIPASQGFTEVARFSREGSDSEGQ